MFVATNEIINKVKYIFQGRQKLILVMLIVLAV